ncbi:diguanylate cyclase [Novosphingobium sp. FSY-8]|uniref:diguanylate cyclase n=1 Tax=Novosphingobium ovatum TaxID=1908523 RepID=A0ABW9XAE9_9SPHN|nr:GGDEF domain-containing protein [Novosphingobium ovatum]NBC35508.1 diguanylate cyclase [Novosphingobium ovatum]
MTAHDPSLHGRPARGLLDWIRKPARTAQTEASTPAPQEEAAPVSEVPDTLRMTRAQLLTDITDFLMAHDLEISGFTLTVAHDYLTGGDGAIMREIDRRIQSRQAVTLEWLEQTTRESRSQDGEILSRMMRKLESNIEEFGRTTTAAKSAASDYSAALTDHVDELGNAAQSCAKASCEVIRSGDGIGVAELVDLARAMLDRTRGLEQEMARSVLQTRALRRSLEQARRTAEEDHLTGLPNRRAFETVYTREYAAAREKGEQLCVAFCDIDNFKRINDTHGHEAGDRVLKTVASALAKISNDRCHVARHGGEEFVVLLRGRSVHQAWELMDDARMAMAERNMVNRATDTPFGKVTFSCGLADVFAFADPRTALRAADKALYRAKSEGRNKVKMADPQSDGSNP